MDLKYKRTCFKIHYESRKDAKNAVREGNLHGKTLTKKLVDVYFCKECECWHTTSASKLARDFYKKRKRKQ